MKIFGITGNYNECNYSRRCDAPADYFLIPDTAILRSSKPFFIPRPQAKFCPAPSLVIRINKLGKGISEKFAHRYYNQVAVGAVIYDVEMMKSLSANGKPLTPAIAFDYNSPLSDFFSKDILSDDFSFSLRISDGQQASWKLSALLRSIDKVVSDLSLCNTLKTGDIIFTGLSFPDITLQLNTRLTFRIQNNEIYYSNIK